MKTLVLVRHCQSDWNAIKRLSGQDDTARLNELGQDQAIKLGIKLAKMSTKFSHFICSDLERAQETASYICKQINIPILVDKRLREVHLGSLDGKTREEIEAMPAGKSLLDSLHKKYDFREFGGEDSAAVLERHRESVTEALGNCLKDQAIIVVGHGSALRTLLRHYFPDRDLHSQGGYDVVALGDDGK